MDKRVFYDTFRSPIAELLITSNGEAITGLFLENSRDLPMIETTWRKEVRLFDQARKQLRAYFARELMEFELVLAPQGTSFQQMVWSELRKIPYGSTTTYGELARKIGNPNGSRAVGAANGRNPISIIIPCHRVIGSNRKLTGYGGGIERKKALLDLEALAISRLV